MPRKVGIIVSEGSVVTKAAYTKNELMSEEQRSTKLPVAIAFSLPDPSISW
jgi:hypothetical protein